MGGPLSYFNLKKEVYKGMLLVIDNYDSFTYNLVQLFLPLYPKIEVVRHDKASIEDIEKWNPSAILISPGPKDPANAGISLSVIKRYYQEKPILGVCLGMQCINEAFGGKTIHAPLPVHGKTSCISHNATGIFQGIPSPFKVMRYHSLCISLPWSSPLKIDAQTLDGIIMGISHPIYPLYGVQFHPESFLTQYGERIAKNFLNIMEDHTNGDK